MTAPSEPCAVKEPCVGATAVLNVYIVYDAKTEELAKRVVESLLEKMRKGCPDGFRIGDEVTFLESPPEGMYAKCLRSRFETAPLDPAGKALVVACFTDGMSDAGKAEFLQLKELAAEDPGITLQAINGKNGLWTRLDMDVVQNNLIATVFKKLVGPSPDADDKAKDKVRRRPQASDGKGKHGRGKPVEPPGDAPPETGKAELPPAAHRHRDPAAAAAGGDSAQGAEFFDSKPPPANVTYDEPEPMNYADLTEEQFKLLVFNTNVRLREGQREHTMKIGVDPTGSAVGVPQADFDKSLDVIKRVAAELSCGMRLVAEKKVKDKVCAEVMLRKDSEDTYIDMRVAICGNVDSGKSTLVGVLTRGMWDDGRGAVRAKVFNHKHELTTGRTSSVSEQYLGYDANGDTVNYAVCGAVDAKAHKLSSKELAGKSAKVVTLYDLAGHEKYLKTTVMGMTGSIPDYACVVVSANNGIQRMTKEHLGLCLALKIPFFVVITRIDSTPEPVAKMTLESIVKMLKQPSVRKLPYIVKKPEDVVICSKNVKNDKVTPIFQVSNVSGLNIDWLLSFVNLAPVRKDWAELAKLPKELIIDSTFFVAGVGTVVGGIVTKGVFKVNDMLWLGPNGNGQFRQVQIKSVQVKGVDVNHVEAGHDASFALKKEKRNAIRKGNVLVECNPKVPPLAYWEFMADIIVLYHSTTIKSRYEPVIHCSTVRQSAKITLVDTDLLRTGDK
eukprot:gene1193-1848_t